MTRTSRPGRTNGGSPALALFMLLIAVFLCLISLQIATLDARTTAPASFAPVPQPKQERSA